MSAFIFLLTGRFGTFFNADSSDLRCTESNDFALFYLIVIYNSKIFHFAVSLFIVE
jgi:hypothetical protein